MPSSQVVDLNSTKLVNQFMSEHAQGYIKYTLSNNFRNPDDYEVLRKIGVGKYSEVFAAVHTNSNRIACIKVLKPVKPLKIMREIQILKALQGGPNIITLFDIIYNPIDQSPALVTEYVRNTGFTKYYPTLQEMDIRAFMYNLLSAVAYAHSKGTSCKNMVFIKKELCTETSSLKISHTTQTQRN
jgi:serine/threonine protein kinase